MSEQNATLTGEIYKRVSPKAYYQQFLYKGLRPDGRGFQEPRPRQSILIASNDGASRPVAKRQLHSSMTKIGKTWVMCGLKAQVASPNPLTPGEGWIVPNLDLPPLCTGTLGVPPPLSQSLSQRLLSILERYGKNKKSLGLNKKNSILTINVQRRSLDKTELCIARGQAVWVLYVDLICLQFDGGLLDASLEAISKVFEGFQLPAVQFMEDLGQVILSTQTWDKNGAPQGKDLSHWSLKVPEAFNFGIMALPSRGAQDSDDAMDTDETVQDQKIVLFDLSREESSLSQKQGTWVLERRVPGKSKSKKRCWMGRFETGQTTDEQEEDALLEFILKQ